MTEYNFKPDYQKWWNKKDLTVEELSILIFGFNPDQYLKFEEILSNPNRTEEERIYMGKFNDGISENEHYSIDHHFTQQCADLRCRNLWGNGKKDFVKNVYEQGMRFAGYFMHPDFLDFLASIRQKPTHFDHFEDHSQYTCDLEKRIGEGVSSEDDAIALLFGVEPKWFSRFCYCHATLYKDQSPEDKFFERQYWVFLRRYYRGIIDFPNFLSSEANRIKERKLWSDNFGNFVQSLHDAGYIFRSNVRGALVYCIM